MVIRKVLRYVARHYNLDLAAYPTKVELMVEHSRDEMH